MKTLTWEKSSCCQGGECVEAAQDGDDVLLRSNLRPGETIRLPRAEFGALMAGVKDGEFDGLAAS